MRTPLLAALSAVMLLSACASMRDSRINPFNWFGRSQATETTTTAAPPPGGVVDDRPLVDQVVAMRVERAPGGAIVHAVALPPSQGYWKADLVPENDGRPVNGVLTVQFRAYSPPKPWPQGTEQSREITAGIFLSEQTLRGVRTIVVRGARNQRSSRR